MFQFTHPGKSATFPTLDLFREYKVSIHAPWEECDSIKDAIANVLDSFNSRTLGRVRQLMGDGGSLSFEFQFTHPGKSATAIVIERPALLDGFNSRTLGRVRRCFFHDSICSGLFQFTHPGKSATDRTPFDRMQLTVSIHAPWEECDTTSNFFPGRGISFNSRTLGRVRP